MSDALIDNERVLLQRIQDSGDEGMIIDPASDDYAMALRFAKRGLVFIWTPFDNAAETRTSLTSQGWYALRFNVAVPPQTWSLAVEAKEPKEPADGA